MPGAGKGAGGQAGRDWAFVPSHCLGPGLGKPLGAGWGLGLGGLSKCLAVPACPSTGWREAALRSEATPTGPLPSWVASLTLGVLTVETCTSALCLTGAPVGREQGQVVAGGSLGPGARPHLLHTAVLSLGPSFSILRGPSDLAHGHLGACAPPLLALLSPHRSCAAQDTSG